MTDLRSEKNGLRSVLTEKRDTLPSEVRKRRDELICSRLLSLACYRFSDTVLLYCPVGSEIDTDPIEKRARADGKRIAYPLCGVEKGQMSFRYVDGKDELKKGTYGIPEPDESCPLCVPGEDRSRMLCIIPALAFDAHGYRLGYGGGYYDRWMTLFRGRGITVGLAYRENIFPTLPRGRFDRRVGLIVTDKGTVITDAD